MLRSQLARREAAVIWRRCMQTDAQESDIGYGFRRPPSIQDKTISRQATYQEFELAMEPSRYAATVKTWRLIHGMTEAIAVVRYIEQQYGPVHEFRFQKDYEIPYMYTTQLYLTFKQRSSLDLIGKGATVKMPSAPLSSLPPPHLLSLADIESALKSADIFPLSAEATAPSDTPFMRPGEPEDNFLELSITPNAPRPLRTTLKHNVVPVIAAIHGWNGFASEENQGQAMELARMRWARFASSRRPFMPRATAVVGEDEMDGQTFPQDPVQPVRQPLGFGEYRRPTGIRTRRSPKVEAAPPAVEEEKVQATTNTGTVEETPNTVEVTPQSETVASTSEWEPVTSTPPLEPVAATPPSEPVASTPPSEPVASTPETEATQSTPPSLESTIAATTVAPIPQAAPPKPKSPAAAPPRPRRSPHLEAAKAQEKSVLMMIKKKETKGMANTRSTKSQPAKKATPDVLVKARQQQQSQQKQKPKETSTQNQTLVTKLRSSLFGNWFK